MPLLIPLVALGGGFVLGAGAGSVTDDIRDSIVTLAGAYVAVEIIRKVWK